MRSNRFLSRLSEISRIRTPPRRRQRRRLPRLESLEDRLVLSTLTVTGTGDSGTGTLRAAIAHAQPGDTIRFAASLDGQTISLTSGELAIGQNLTIKGPGAGLLDVDAGGTSRIFDVTSASAAVAISGLTISGGNSEDGGGILDQGGTLTLTGDTLTNDQAIAGGGAAGAGGDGGPGGVSTGGVIFVYTQLSVSGSTFLDNQAIAGSGGAGGAGGSGGPGGLAEGGAIDDQAAPFTIIPPPLPVSTIASSVFVGNESVGGAGGNGSQSGDGGDGGISFAGDIVCFGYLSITSSSFLFGQALGGAGGSGATGGAGGSAQGGSLQLLDGLYNPGNPLAVTDSVTDSTVVGAVAEGGSGGSGGPSGTGGSGGLAQGGGIAVGYAENVSGTFQVTVSGTILTGNAALGGAGGTGTVGGDGGDAQGGGLFVDPYSTVVLDSDAIFGNLADGGSGATNGTGIGGGVYLSGTGSTRKNTTIAGNSASTSNNDVYGTFN